MLEDTLPQAAPRPAVQPPAPTSHPIGFWFFIWGEFAERCSFYGMKAILLFYLIDRLEFEKGQASGTLNYFKAACYFLPLLGGFVADNYFGKYRTIVGFSLFYILGHVILGVESVPFLIVALALLAMGAGVIKPNISTLMGMTYDQQRPGQLKLRSDAFAMFYVAINTGAFFSSLALPLVRNAWGYQKAFLVPAALMAIAFVLFAIGKPFYAVETIQRIRISPEERRQRWTALRQICGLVAASLALFATARWSQARETWRRIPDHVSAERLERWRALRRILGLFAAIVFFWSVLEQYDNTWTLFARDHIDLNIFDFAEGTWQWSVLAFVRDHLHIDVIGKPVSADQFQALNPILVMVLVPPITILWHRLARAGLRLRPTDKMFIGFLLTILTPVIMSIAGLRAAEVGRISALWLVSAYVVVTAAEVCISVVSFELAFSAAPASMKAFVTACWLVTMSCGDMINSQVTPYYEATISLAGTPLTLSPGIFFGLFALLMIPVTGFFVVMARRFNRIAPSDG